MKIDTRNKFKIGLLISLLIIMASVWLIVQSEIQLQKNKKNITAAYQKLIQLEEITTLMNDAQRGVRGYQITKDESFLEPYIGTEEKVLHLFQVLKASLNNDNGGHFLSLDTLIHQTFDILDIMVVLQKTGYIEEAAHIEKLKISKKSMDSTRYHIQSLKKQVNVRLQLSLANSSNYNLTNNYLISFIFIIAICLVFISYYFLNHDLKIKAIRENELLHAKKIAESENNSKSHFLANMSHEIRTPLNAIIGFTDVLLKQDVNKMQQDEYLEYIRSSGNLLLNLIGNILDLSKIEEGKFELNKESFFFKQVLSSVLLPYQFKAREKGLELELNFDTSVPHYVISDAHFIKQILVNLVSNAIKFTKKGKISVDVQNISNEKFGKEAELKFCISDSGIGIPKEKQSIILEKFTQADSSMHREYGGSGLGLTIVRELVNLLGGKLIIESPSKLSLQEYPGTAITFIFKVEIDNTRIAPKISEENIPGQISFEEKLNILIVEDNPINQRLAKIILKKLGCAFEFASNGKEAVEAVQKSGFDIILMDVQMPVMDGYEATRFLRNNLKLDIPIIGLTANVFKEDIKNCLDAGMNDFLGKPYSEKQLYEMLRKWHNSSLTITSV